MAVVSDPISDFLTRFKNATLAQKEEFSAPYSKVKEEIARILKELVFGGYIKLENKKIIILQKLPIRY